MSSPKHLAVSSVSDGIAKLEKDDTSVFYIPAIYLPKGAKEQDWLTLGDDGSYHVDEDLTSKKQNHNISLFKKLVDKGKNK